MLHNYASWSCLEVYWKGMTLTNILFLEGINGLSHQCIVRENQYVTYLCLLGWPKSLLKGSDLDQIWWWKWEKTLKCFEGRQRIISSMHGWRKVVYSLIMPLGVAWILSKGNKLFWVKMRKILESICIKGQCHIVTIDLFFSGSTCHAEGSSIKWTAYVYFSGASDRSYLEHAVIW